MGIQHFSHPEHPLNWVDSIEESGIPYWHVCIEVRSFPNCDGCNEVMCFPGYACHECEFYLHKSCAELPPKILHPLHPHALTCSITDDSGIICDGCRDLNINGFTFSCSWQIIITGSSAYCCIECEFFIHESCTEIPMEVHHPFHSQHIPVAQAVAQDDYRSCAAYSVKDDNPLTQYLMDSNDKVDYSMYYYCDVCETPGNPKHHAYCCKECIYIAHVECIISKECPPSEILQYLVPRSRHEAEQGNNIDGEVDESEKESNEVQETDTEEEQETDIEDSSLAQLDERIAGVKKKMDKLASKLEVLQVKRAQNFHSLS
ncbi:hypothetical protein Dsin_024182 [Dipteronia sinensis]|uniref:Phorbol-ester/DAG-type domain-containing protein n=1 Tax=Dipteronia sinensis TaxID=43782 RepID=A0AAE0A5M5_9ROSI|nr:hypothetical protein Dsin_024182 [Dipteronia sinensis]